MHTGSVLPFPPRGRCPSCGRKVSKYGCSTMPTDHDQQRASFPACARPAIAHDGNIQLLVEVKKVTEPLRLEHASQLYRYFAVTNARIAILTNGEQYEFYTDLDAPNRMDSKPFLVLDLSDIDDTLLPELAKLTKESFDLDSVISAAGELKYIGQLKRVLASQFKEPTDDWVKFLTTRVYEGAIHAARARTSSAVPVRAGERLAEECAGRVRLVRQRVQRNGRGTGARPSASAVPEGDIVTQTRGCRMVWAIVCGQVAPNRVEARDDKTYRSKRYLGCLRRAQGRDAHPDLRGRRHLRAHRVPPADGGALPHHVDPRRSARHRRGGAAHQLGLAAWRVRERRLPRCWRSRRCRTRCTSTRTIRGPRRTGPRPVSCSGCRPSGCSRRSSRRWTGC